MRARPRRYSGAVGTQRAQQSAIREIMPPDDGYFAGHARWSLIEHYEAIAAASRQMLEAARADDWDEVARQEARCRTLIGGLKRATASGALARADRRQRLALLRTILADDAEIREIAEPWLKEIEALLQARPVATPR